MNTTIEEIIKTRTFASLEEAEKISVLEMVENEQEFNQMKQFLLEIETIIPFQNVEPSVVIKTSLDQIFQAKHPGIAQTWEAPKTDVKTLPFYQNNWIRVAALVIFTFSVITVYFQTSSTSDQKLATVKPIQQKIPTQVIEKTTSADENTQKVVPEETEPILIAEVSPQTRSEKLERKVTINSELTSSTIEIAPVETTVETFSSAKGMSADLDPQYGSTNQQLAFVKPVETIELLEYITPAF